jgi:hypothetical protein
MRAGTVMYRGRCAVFSTWAASLICSSLREGGLTRPPTPITAVPSSHVRQTKKRSYPSEGLAPVRLGPGTGQSRYLTFSSVPLPGFSCYQRTKGGGSGRDVCCGSSREKVRTLLVIQPPKSQHRSPGLYTHCATAIVFVKCGRRHQVSGARYRR